MICNHSTYMSLILVLVANLLIIVIYFVFNNENETIIIPVLMVNVFSNLLTNQQKQDFHFIFFLNENIKIIRNYVCCWLFEDFDCFAQHSLSCHHLVEIYIIIIRKQTKKTSKKITWTALAATSTYQTNEQNNDLKTIFFKKNAKTRKW